MDFHIIFMILCIAQTTLGNKLDLTKTSSDPLDVTSYGAAGDGNTDDSQAFLRAWSDLCGATTPNPTLLIPAGKTFLLQAIRFKGPCKSSNVRVQVLGNIVAPSQISSWTGSTKFWLLFSHIDGLTIDGSGQIDGQGSVWWTACSKPSEKASCNRRPTALRFGHVNNLQFSGLKHINSAKSHIVIDSCTGVTVSNIHISAPEHSPNTDGIDISDSSQVLITNSFIGTGDDCVAIEGGSSYVNITNVACGPGHGISVGSLGGNGSEDKVEEVHVRNCNFTKTMTGARIKTWQGGSGYARKISFDQITFLAVERPIVIDQYYCIRPNNCKNETSAVKVSDITYTRVQGTSAREKAIDLSCSETVPCTNIVLDQVNITSARRGQKVHAICSFAQGKATATSPAVSCLS